MRRVRVGRFKAAVACGALPSLVGSCAGGPAVVHTPRAPGIRKIKHVVVIMQENRSFDDYFGTYPGADGIPMKDGTPTVCVPDPAMSTCVAPFVDHNDADGG